MWDADWHAGMMSGVSGSWFWPLFGHHWILGMVLLIAAVLLVVALFRKPDAARSDPDIFAGRVVKGGLSSSDHIRTKREILGGSSS